MICIEFESQKFCDLSDNFYVAIDVATNFIPEWFYRI